MIIKIHSAARFHLILNPDLGNIHSLSGHTAELKMTSVQLKSFKEQQLLLVYATNILVRIMAYLGYPYVSPFETDAVRRITRITISLQVMSLTTLIANFGGMLVISFGFSFLSLVEIVYLLFSFVSRKIVSTI